MRKSHAAVSSDWEPAAARPVKYSHLSWKSKFYYLIHKRSPFYLTHLNLVTYFENSFAMFKYSSPIYDYIFQNISFFDDHNHLCISHLHHVYHAASWFHLSNIRNVGWKKKSAMLLLLPHCRVTSSKGTHSTHLGGSIVLYIGKSKTVRHLSERMCPCDVLWVKLEYWCAIYENEGCSHIDT